MVQLERSWEGMMMWWWIPVVSAGTHQWDPAVDTAITLATGITWGALYLGVEDTLPPADTSNAVAPTGLD
ncbi:MAG: hypothetical protein QGG40_16825, partial [Myxococcota bacterium]|nr:hypothetical protein [Myxococcota bacterium]